MVGSNHSYPHTSILYNSIKIIDANQSCYTSPVPVPYVEVPPSQLHSKRRNKNLPKIRTITSHRCTVQQGKGHYQRTLTWKTMQSSSYMDKFKQSELENSMPLLETKASPSIHPHWHYSTSVHIFHQIPSSILHKQQ